jgi:hypothetical protein
MIITVVTMCVIIIASQSEGSMDSTLAAYPMTIVLCIAGFVFGVFVIGMLGLHTYLTIMNLTTA